MNQDTSVSKSRAGSSFGASARAEAETPKNQIGDTLERGNAAVSGANEAAQDGLSSHVRNLQADITSLKDTLARLVSQVGGQTATTVRQVGQSVAAQVGSAASNAADAGSELATSAKEQAKTFAAELEGMAKRNPLGALAGALLVGVIIGMVSRGRN